MGYIMRSLRKKKNIKRKKISIGGMNQQGKVEDNPANSVAKEMNGLVLDCDAVFENLGKMYVSEVNNEILKKFGRKPLIVDIQGITAGRVKPESFEFFDKSTVELIVRQILSLAEHGQPILILSQGDKPMKDFEFAKQA